MSAREGVGGEGDAYIYFFGVIFPILLKQRSTFMAHQAGLLLCLRKKGSNLQGGGGKGVGGAHNITTWWEA